MTDTRMRRLGNDVKALLDANGSGSADGVGFYFEAEEAQRHKERRKIVWVSSDGRITPPNIAGAQESDKAATPRRIDLVAVLRERVRCTVSAETRQVTEHLVNNLIVALKRQIGDLEFEGYAWPTQDNAGRTHRDQVCVVTFYPRFGVPNQIVPLPTEDYLAEAGDLLTVCVSHNETSSFDDVGDQVPLNPALVAIKPYLTPPD